MAHRFSPTFTPDDRPINSCKRCGLAWDDAAHCYPQKDQILYGWEIKKIPFGANPWCCRHPSGVTMLSPTWQRAVERGYQYVAAKTVAEDLKDSAVRSWADLKEKHNG